MDQSDVASDVEQSGVNYQLKVETRLLRDDLIEQVSSLVDEHGDIVQRFARQVIDMKEQHVREVLIAAGWIPPESELNRREISDGFHTFDELYAHRYVLFIALMQAYPALSWRAKVHADGSMHGGGWFVAGMSLPTGQISYHLPKQAWPALDDKGIITYDRAPEWDGHTPDDVIGRLADWCGLPKGAGI